MRRRRKKPDPAEQAVLDLYRGPGKCSLCRKDVKRREPHHIVTRGAGGPSIPENLIALCATFSGGENCHDRVHSNSVRRLTKEDLLDLVAKRMGLEKWVLFDRIYRAIRARTGGNP